MKCQHCNKPATFHITELTSGEPQELHLCEDHAREYLSQSSDDESVVGSVAASMAQQMAEQLGVGETVNQLTEIDRQTCPVCGIAFHEFRSSGRLGCPFDYTVFNEQLEPLILNIHGETEHRGKHPSRSAGESAKRIRLIRLRREMQEAVREERYEEASKLRDEIRTIEESIGHTEDDDSIDPPTSEQAE